jgi:hypothetical protein
MLGSMQRAQMPGSRQNQRMDNYIGEKYKCVGVQQCYRIIGRATANDA